MIVGHQPFAGNGGEDRGPDALGEGYGGGPAIDRTAAEDHHWLFGPAEQGGGLRQLPAEVPPDRAGGVPARGALARRRRLLHEVDGQGDMNRPGAAASQPGEAGLDEVRQILRDGGRAAEGGESAHGLRLVGQLVDMTFRNARGRRAAHAGDDQHGDRIGKGLGDGRRGIQQARTRNEEAYPRPARSPGIAVRHESRALLVARLDMTDAATRQAAIELQRMGPRDAEHGIDAMLLQQPHEAFAAAEQFGHGLAALLSSSGGETKTGGAKDRTDRAMKLTDSAIRPWSTSRF